MSMSETAFMAGYVGAEIERTRDVLEAQNRDKIIADLRDEGILLPEYDWQDKAFLDELEQIAIEWFQRHPEVIRGSGDFAKMHPEKDVALDTLGRMVELGRITPKEYLIIHREIMGS